MLPGAVSKYTLPIGVAGETGARFVSADSRPYTIIAVIDDEGSTHDWGYTLLPETTLSSQVKVGWAPGCDPSISPTCSGNYSPVWVTAASATTLQIDRTGDGTVDATQAIVPFQAYRIYNSASNTFGTQTGMRIFSDNGVLLAASWGQDPSTGPGAVPTMDMGTTVFNLPAIVLTKDGKLKNDVNSNGLVEPGDSIEYTLSIQNSGAAAALNVNVKDAPDPDVTYVNGSTFRDSSPVNDSGTTNFPLDEGGLTIGSLAADATTVITYEFTVDLTWPDNKSTADNTATVTVNGGPPTTADASVPVAIQVLTLDKSSSKGGNSDPGDIGSTAPGEVIEYTMRPRVPGSTLVTDAYVSDLIPANTTYVPDSDTPEVADHPTDSDPLTWKLGSNTPGTTGTDPGGAFCPTLIALEPDADTFINGKSDKQDENFGGATKLLTSWKVGEVKHALMHYDLSAIPADAVIASASMQLQGNQNRLPDTASVYRMLTTWSEYGSTWDASDTDTSPFTRWAGGGDFTSADYNTGKVYATFPVQKDTATTFDAKEMVEDWLTLANTGMIIVANVGANDGDGEWFSREEGDPGDPKRPQLTITYLKRTTSGCDSGGSGTTFVSNRDTYINQKSDKQDENKGNADTVLAMEKSGNEDLVGLIGWDVSFIPADAIVTGVTLKLEFDSDSDTVIGFHELTTPWTEGNGADNSGATWDDRNGTNRWASGGDFSTSDYDTGALFTFTNDNKQVENLTDADLTALVQDWVDGDKDNNGLAIIATGPDGKEAKIFAREKAPDKTPPTLIVQWTLAAKGATQLSMSAEGTLVSDGDPITVKVTVENSGGDTNVQPTTPLTVNQFNGADAVSCTPDPQTAVTLAANTPHTFTYTCTADAGTVLPGSVTFEAGITSDNVTSGDAVYQAAKSNSVLIAPPLKFSVKVDDGVLPGGKITNTATAVSDGTAPVTATAVDNLPTPNPALTLVKSTTTTNYDSVGDTISYSYMVTNSGNVPVVPPYAVADDKATVSCPQTPNPLNPGAFITCTATYTVTQADLTAGSVVNVATASAVYNGSPVTSNQDTVTVPAVQTPALTLDKSTTTTQLRQRGRHDQLQLQGDEQRQRAGGSALCGGRRQGDGDLPADAQSAESRRIHHLHGELHGHPGRHYGRLGGQRRHGQCGVQRQPGHLQPGYSARCRRCRLRP